MWRRGAVGPEVQKSRLPLQLRRGKASSPFQLVLVRVVVSLVFSVICHSSFTCTTSAGGVHGASRRSARLLCGDARARHRVFIQAATVCLAR